MGSASKKQKLNGGFALAYNPNGAAERKSRGDTRMIGVQGATIRQLKREVLELSGKVDLLEGAVEVLAESDTSEDTDDEDDVTTSPAVNAQRAMAAHAANAARRF